MQIGQRVRTIDGKEGIVRHITKFSVGTLQLEECCWVELPGAVAGYQHPRYLASQLTPIPEKPKEAVECWRASKTFQCQVGRLYYECDGKEYCHNRTSSCASYGLAQRLQWAWGICGCRGNQYCEACLPPNPTAPLYICDHANGCLSEKCHAKQRHAICARTEFHCTAVGNQIVQCIPVEDWWILGYVLDPRYTEATIRQTIKNAARPQDYRAFKWSQGVDSIDIHSW